MKKSKTMYNVWADGSYRDESCNVGAGWIVRHDGEEVRGAELSRLELHGDKPHGSDVAEIWAVCRALETIPPGAAVQLHMDSQTVLNWLKAKEIRSSTKRDVKTLSFLFDCVMKQVGTFESFEIRHVKDRRNENMDTAHKLSRAASTQGGMQKSKPSGLHR